MRVKRILAPTDFSLPSQMALGPALFFAELFDAELILQHVLVFREADLTAPESHFPNPNQLFEKLQALAQSELGKLLEPYRERMLRIREVIDRAPETVRGIVERAESEDADLLILGTHGRTGPAHLLLGSVSAEVLRRSRRPTLTVPSREGTRQLPKLRRIAVADDFSPASGPALEAASDLARQVGAELDLVHVLVHLELPLPPAAAPLTWPVPLMAELEPRVRESLAADRSRWAKGIPGRDVVLHGRDARTLAAWLRDEEEGKEVDLLVQGTAQHTGLDRLLLGSFAERTVRFAPCPVLTVPGKGVES